MIKVNRTRTETMSRQTETARILSHILPLSIHLHITHAIAPPIYRTIMDTSILFTLIITAFSAATILPTASEAVFIWAIHQQAQYIIVLWLAASLANTAGSLTSYIIGRLIPTRRQPHPRATGYLKRYGSTVLLLSWLPIVGDALPLAAGYLRLPFWACILSIFIGKTARYGVIAWAWSQLN